MSVVPPKDKAKGQNPAERPSASQQPAPNAKAKKVTRKYNPIGMHLVQSYELIYHLSFLLNKKKCFIGNVTDGYALSTLAIRRLRKEVNAENELPFLPTSSFIKEEDKTVKHYLNNIIGHSVLEAMAEPINKQVKLLLDTIAHIDDNDESDYNIGEIITLFREPIEQPSDTNKNGKNEQVAIRNITPYTLVQEIQKIISILRQRLLLELETIGQLRHKWISPQDSYHALVGSNPLEVRGRLKVAREILTALKAMEILKTQNFTGEFHPKITLDRAIEMMNQWGPGTPPRMFRVQTDKNKGKIIVLNEKLNEQLEILKEATHNALGYGYHFPQTNELVERSKKQLQAFYQVEEPSSTDQELTEDENDTGQTKEEEPAKTGSIYPITGPESFKSNNHLTYEEILQFYYKIGKENINKYLDSIDFETYCAKYLTHHILTVDHVNKLREMFTTVQMDLTAAVDLYLLEAKKVAIKIKQITKKLRIRPNSKELFLIVQPGETTRKSLFSEAIVEWTEMYTKITKKYVLIELAEHKKLITDSQGLQALCDMETDEAISYLEQIEALIHAEKEGYISQEQKERYLDPEQTNDVVLKSIMAFFSAIDKYDFVKRCELIIKGFQKQQAQFEASIEEDSSKAKALKEPLKQLELFVTETEPKFLIQELLNAEIYNMEPASIYLFMERILLNSELKIEYNSFRHAHEQALKDLISKLGGSVDVDQCNKLFFTANSEESSLLGILNKINGTPLVSNKNVFHKNDNIMIRECVLRSFQLDRQGRPHSSSITSANAHDLICVDYCVEIMTYFQFSFMTATRKVLALDAETKRSENQSNELGVKPDRVTEMRTQCECILDKQVPLSFALKQLEAIWQTLEQDKIVAKEAKAIAELQKKLDGNVAGGSSLYNRLGNNPDNVEMMDDYQKKAQAAYAKYRKTLEDIAERLRALGRNDNIPKHILEYQRQILIMERSIYQTVEEIKLGSPQTEMLKKQVHEKQQRIHKYKKVLGKYQKDNPDVTLPQIR